MSIGKIFGLTIGYGGLLAIFSLKQKNHKLYVLLMMYIFGTMKRGTQQSIFYALFGFLQRPRIKLEGYVKPGYEELFQEFQNNFENGMEQGAQLSAYVRGEKVIDVCGSCDIENYDSDSLQIIFSSTKNVTALVIAMLVDRKLLDYNEKVCKYWPDFAKNGKQDITLKQIMRHESGLRMIIPHVTQYDISREQIKQNKIGERIENMSQKFPNPKKNTTREYHATSRGYILNEIIRRVDPQQRTIGEFVQDEICKPLKLDFSIGLPQEKLNRVHKMTLTLKQYRIWSYLQSFVPHCIGGKLERKKNIFMILIIDIVSYFLEKNAGNVDPNSQEFLCGEMPSGNGVTNASNLAKIGCLLAQKGEFEGIRLLSEETWQLAHSEPTIQVDPTLINKKTKFTLGGFNIYDEQQDIGAFYDKSGFAGWQGYGGSVLQWHAEDQISIAYTMNLMDADFSNMRGLKLKTKLAEIVRKLKKQL